MLVPDQEVNPEGKAMVEFHDGDTELVDLLHERYCLSAGPSLCGAREPNRGSASLRFFFAALVSFSVFVRVAADASRSRDPAPRCV